MAKNRKNNSAAVRFGPAVKAFVLCLFIGGSGVGYVWQKSQISTLGRQIAVQEKRLAELRRINKLKADHLAALQTPPAIDAKIRKMNLPLMPPPVNQIVRVIEIQARTPAAPPSDAPSRIALKNSVAGF